MGMVGFSFRMAQVGSFMFSREYEKSGKVSGRSVIYFLWSCFFLKHMVR